MFERYTQKARRVIFFARYEASQVGSPYIESEHLLLGLLREDSGFFAAVTSLDLTQESLRQQIEAVHPAGNSLPKDADLPLSNECKRILAYAAEESVLLGDRHIGTEHLLLGILREDRSLAAKLLRQRGADLTAIRKTFATGELTRPRPSKPEPQRSFFHHVREKLAALRVSPAPDRLNPAGIEFHKFSEKARRAILFARYEARNLGASAIEPEHMLLGITHEMSYSTLQNVAETIRKSARDSSKAITESGLPLSERSQQILATAREEATRRKAEWVRPEHILLGIAGEADSPAARMMRDHGMDASRICQAIEDAASRPDLSRS